MKRANIIKAEMQYLIDKYLEGDNFKGKTVRTILEAIESCGPEMRIYWGAYDETELNTVI